MNDSLPDYDSHSIILNQIDGIVLELHHFKYWYLLTYFQFMQITAYVYTNWQNHVNLALSKFSLLTMY